MEDKMVELSRFTLVSEAEMLANLLKSEGVDCYVRDCFINQIYSGVDFGGVKVELLEKDLQRAKEIMKAFHSPFEGGQGDVIEGNQGNVSPFEGGQGDVIEGNPEDVFDENQDEVFETQNKSNLSRTMTIYLIIILSLVGIIILLNKYYNG